MKTGKSVGDLYVGGTLRLVLSHYWNLAFTEEFFSKYLPYCLHKADKFTNTVSQHYIDIL